MTRDVMKIWQANFPQFIRPDDRELQALLGSASLVSLPADQTVFEPGANCKNYLMVISGHVRVQLLGENGREIVLYHVNSGESCIMTTSCLLGGKTYPAEGITGTEVTALVLQARDFNRALQKSERFRQLVFENFGQRLADIIAKMEQVAFGAIDSRLVQSLLQRAESTDTVTGTHQSLANELGTAREVVSRHLKQFEVNGWVTLGRGTITIVDHEALQALAKNNAL